MSIKDMQFVTVEQVQRLREVAIMTEKQLEAAQLHIKELRAALEEIASYRGHSTAMLHVIAQQALAKKPDTRALDKALLEARIDALDNVSIWGGGESDIEDFAEKYKAKLDELNLVRYMRNE